MEPYYYSVMTKEEKVVYQTIYREITTGKSTFSVPALALKEISSVYDRFRLDHPEIVGLDSFSVSRYPGADSMTFLRNTRFDAKKMKSIQDAVTARLNKIAAGFRFDGFPAGRDRAAVEYAHTFILTNVKYDKLEKLYAHEINGPLCHGIGVCEGISKAVQAILTCLEVPCTTVIAPSVSHENQNHAWNIVWVNGKPLHLDATFDLSDTERTGKKSKRWFLLPDERIFTDHGTPIYPVPACVSER